MGLYRDGIRWCCNSCRVAPWSECWTAFVVTQSRLVRAEYNVASTSSRVLRSYPIFLFDFFFSVFPRLKLIGESFFE
jgi:hypothetical protein